jgi:hypothetical protein
MLRKPYFWIALILVSMGCTYFSARFFSAAFPIVTLDLKMNRAEALSRAAEIASRLQLPPSGYQQVASFEDDQEVRNFIELEAGGTSALRSVMAQGYYHPYNWSVRHFKPGETRETRIRFTPRGEPYGFSVKLPENESGAALAADKAKEIAEESAVRDWDVRFLEYRIVEQSREVRPGGRVDHTFVYERPNVTIGEGRYRLRLVVGGDRLTALAHFVKVPEAFSRRYEHMRSSNNAVTIGGSVALVVLYLIGGCGVGLFFLLRSRWILWKQPLLWGFFIAFLQLLAGINQWPLIWTNYDTAVSPQGFIAQQVIFLVGEFLLYLLLFTVSFMAAESLSRRAFPNQIQLWSLWSSDVAGSKAVIGRTAAGYLLVSAFFAYDVLLYFLASKSLGWWTPSDALVQPDVLSHYLPWLSAIALPAQAGFWEESLFRAVPLAAAALLGSRYGRRGWWIAGAMIVQAAIFGSGHAAYATQPFYARVVELILPSFGFGGLYLCFGLLPGIALHFVFDVVWFALPLFVASSPGIWLDRVLVIVIALTPLWIVLVGPIRRMRLREKWVEVPESRYNRAWQPPVPREATPEAEAPAAGVLNAAFARWLSVAGAAGLLLWGALSFLPERTKVPPLTIGRDRALELANQELQKRGIALPGSWSVLTSIDSAPGQQDRFVWQTAGREVYAKLLGVYLPPPHWVIRYARFEGDVAERAEEYQALVSDAGAFRFRHILPEARPGKNLSELEARTLAQEALRRELAVNPASLKEVSAVPSQLKARTDWVFTFSTGGAPELPQGEKRLAVRISGDSISGASRFVHVPEDWIRQERDRQTIPGLISIVSPVLIVLISLGGIVAAIVSWSRKRFVVSSFLLILALLFGLNVFNLANSIRGLIAQFSTAQPYKIQLFIAIVGGIVGMLLLSGGIGLIGGLVHRWCAEERHTASRQDWIMGLSLGGVAAGILALGSKLGPSLSPEWADYSSLNNYVPFLGRSTGAVSGYFTQALVLLFVLALMNRLTGNWRMRRIFYGVLLFLFGFLVAGLRPIETLGSWAAAGAITGVLLLGFYLVAYRFSAAVSAITLGLMSILALLKSGLALSLALLPASICGAVAVALAVWWWFYRLQRQ